MSWRRAAGVWRRPDPFDWLSVLDQDGLGPSCGIGKDHQVLCHHALGSGSSRTVCVENQGEAGDRTIGRGLGWQIAIGFQSLEEQVRAQIGRAARL